MFRTVATLFFLVYAPYMRVHGVEQALNKLWLSNGDEKHNTTNFKPIE
jgi:hypothetical protein